MAPRPSQTADLTPLRPSSVPLPLLSRHLLAIIAPLLLRKLFVAQLFRDVRRLTHRSGGRTCRLDRGAAGIEAQGEERLMQSAHDSHVCLHGESIKVEIHH